MLDGRLTNSGGTNAVPGEHLLTLKASAFTSFITTCCDLFIGELYIHLPISTILYILQIFYLCNDVIHVYICQRHSQILCTIHQRFVCFVSLQLMMMLLLFLSLLLMVRGDCGDGDSDSGGGGSGRRGSDDGYNDDGGDAGDGTGFRSTGDGDDGEGNGCSGSCDSVGGETDDGDGDGSGYGW